jgi:hypothetical protein
MFDNEIEDLLTIIKSLPFNLESKLMAIVLKALFYAEKLGGWPASWKEPIANSIGHQVIWIFKEANYDKASIRIQVKNRLITMFDLDPDWLPKWPLEPPTPA